MAHILRGEIPWADVTPVRGSAQAGVRLVLIISSDIFNARAWLDIALALASQPQRAGFPLTVELEHPDLPKKSWVKISQIRTLALERIGARICRLEPEILAKIVEGVNEIVGD
ncbi:MAG: type II toxin-antitoxin system PemK/MazF family toxin [Desulfobulbia bacterium]|jgi:mRNA interferase MazF